MIVQVDSFSGVDPGVYAAATGSIRLESLFLTLPTREQADQLRPLNGVAALKDKVQQEDRVQTGLAGVESNNTVLGAMPVRQRYISIRRDGFVDEVLHKY